MFLSNRLPQRACSLRAGRLRFLESCFPNSYDPLTVDHFLSTNYSLPKISILFETPRVVDSSEPRPSWPGNRLDMKSPVFCPDLESGIALYFRAKIVRDFQDKSRYSLPRPSQKCTVINRSRPELVPDGKSPPQKWGTFQGSRNARVVCPYFTAKARRRGKR